MNSYFQFRCYPGCLDADSQWILGSYTAGQFPGIFLVKPLVKIFGIKWTGIVAMVINNAALLVSAWVLQHSVAWTAALYGILMGPTVGINNTIVMQMICGWAPEWSTLLIATTTSFPTLLSILQNQIITAYVNPENFKANSVVGPKTYFSQPQLLDRVPRAVIIIAAMTFVIQVVGYILVSNPPRPPFDTTVKDISIDLNSSNRAVSDDIKSLDKSNHRASDQDIKKYGTDFSIAECTKSNHQICNNQIFSSEGSREHTVLTLAKRQIKTGEDFPISWKPSEVLQSPAYYALVIFGIALIYGVLVKANFYKEFAQIYIHNDRYLTLVGTLIPVTSICSRIVFGALIDKGFLNLKDVAVFGTSLNSILCFFWYIIPGVNDTLYLFLVLGLAVAQSLFYVVIPCAPLRLFGPDHLATNLGLIYASEFLTGLSIPIVVSPLIDGLGWFWLFTCCGILSLLSLCLVVVTNFNTQRVK
ncbi:hypothetical protein RRG08_003604 [Elysia crispata]|uniref:Major facilitator superfamily (MFS) profile domain-containing protein n=1 Tax=Elysia crispata TaxID=231223 RepID=A0AAE1ASI8_9GAST|nr:hypothetical protein RRG08_003604 [Elysia crispata]